MTSRRTRRQRGFALVSVLMLTMMVLLTAGMVLMPSMTGRWQTMKSGSNAAATNVADAGLDYAMATLNATIPSGQGTTLAALPSHFVQGSGAAANTWTYNDAGNGNFFASNFDKSVPTLSIRIPATVPIAGGPGTANDYRIIRSETVVNGSRKREEAIVHLQSNLVDSPISPFPRAITAKGNLAANGVDTTVRTDSYDSSNGGYGGANLGTNGGVHTNGSIVDGGTYRGNISAAGTIDSGAGVEGPGNTVRQGVAPESIPDAPAAPAPTRTVYTGSLPLTITPAAGEVIYLRDSASKDYVSMSGNATQVLSLNPGKYVVRDLSIIGSASIQVVGAGQVELFVLHDLDAAGGGIVNSSTLPTNLKIVATGTSGNCDLSGNSNFYGVLQAPGRNVTIGGTGEFFGAVVANDFLFNGSNSVVHYDDAVGRAFSAMAQVNRPARFKAIAVNVLDKN